MDSVWLVLLSAGLVAGFSKFSVGGMGMLTLPIIMVAFPSSIALGIIIPMYIIIDIMAVSSYHKNIAWPVIFKLLPLSIIGVGIGGWVLSGIDAEQFRIILCVIILAIIVLGIVLDHQQSSFMRHSLTAYIMGFFAGIISLIANAAGPLFSLFFLEQGLSKESYMSTRVWTFFFVNLSKLPILFSLDILNWEVFTISLRCIPGLIIGAMIGYWFLKRLNFSQLKWLIRIMAAIAAIRLILV